MFNQWVGRDKNTQLQSHTDEILMIKGLGQVKKSALSYIRAGGSVLMDKINEQGVTIQERLNYLSQ